MARVIVLDAGVLIAHLDPDDRFHEAARDFLEEHEEFDFAVNAITIAEILVRPTAAGRSAGVVGALERLAILRLDVTAAEAAAIAEVRSATRLRMPEALVLYSAERRGAELVTTDRALAEAAGARGTVARLLTA